LLRDILYKVAIRHIASEYIPVNISLKVMQLCRRGASFWGKGIKAKD